MEVYKMKWTVLICLNVIGGWAQEVKPGKNDTLNVKCPFTFVFSGCGTTRDMEGHYIATNAITLSVTTNFTKERDCFVKYKTYKWVMSPLVPSNTMIPIGDEQTVTIIPSQIQNHRGRNVVRVRVMLHDILGITDLESAEGVCYLSLHKPFPRLVVEGVDYEYKCGVETEIVLKGRIIQTDYAESEFQFEWLCPVQVCGGAELDQPELKFRTTIQECEKSFVVTLSVNHPVTLERWSHAGKLVFTHTPYNLYVECEPECNYANWAWPLTVKVKEKPNVGSKFIWMWEELYPLDAIRDFLAPNDVLLIKSKSLTAGITHRIIVKTEDGWVKHFEVTMGEPPTDLICKINPTVGDPFKDRFNISCAAKSDRSPITYQVYQGEEKDLVWTSNNHRMVNLEISENPVWVDAIDSLGMTHNGSLILNATIKVDFETNLNDLTDALRSRIYKLKLYLHERDYIGIVNEIDGITKQTMIPITIPWALYMMDYLSRVQTCRWSECIIKVSNSLRRLAGVQFGNDSQMVDDYILKAASVLFTMTKTLEHLLATIISNEAHAMLDVFTSMHKASRRIMELVDPVLFHPNVDDDVRQIHYRKVLQGNELVRKALKNIGLFITSHIPYPSSPFVVGEVGSLEAIQVLSNDPHYINLNLESHQENSYFQFTNESVQKIREVGYPVSVTLVSYSKDFWWNTMTASAGNMIEVFLFQNQLDGKGWAHTRQPPGLVQAHINISNLIVEEVSGSALRPSPNKGDKFLDASVSVHKVKKTRGYGALFLQFAEDYIGKIHVHVNTTTMPDFNMVSSEQPLNQSQIIHSYYSSDNSNIYIGILASESNSILPLNYTFNLSLILCVTRSENSWKSESCWFLRKKGSTVTCGCERMSLINVISPRPNSSWSKCQIIELSTEIVPHFYLAEILVVLFFLLGILFIIAIGLDKRDESKRTAWFLADNYPGDNYPYLISVFTGARCMSGTLARVAVRFTGSESISRVHILSTPQAKKLLSQAYDCWLIMFTKQNLGVLQKMEIWFDDHGCNSDWYCDLVIVYDLRTDKAFKFSVHSWLTAAFLCNVGETKAVYAAEELKGKVKKNEWKRFVRSHIHRLMRQEHRWASVFIRHPRNLHSRLERATILTVAILVTITTTALFSDAIPGPADEHTINYLLPDFKATCLSLIVMCIVTFAMTYLFSLGKLQLQTELGMEEHIDGKNRPLLRHTRNYFTFPITYMPVMTDDAYTKLIKRLNHWQWVAYTISLLVITACTIWAIFLGMSLAENMTMVWLISFIIALVLDVYVINPAQITVTGILISYYLRKHAHDLDVIYVDSKEKTVPYENMEQRLGFVLKYRLKARYKPPLTWQLERRASHDSRTNISNIFNMMNIFIITLMVGQIVVIIKKLDIERHYHKNQQLSEHFKRSLKKSSDVRSDMAWNRRKYYEYLHVTVMRALHRLHWYNRKPLNTRWKGSDGVREGATVHKGYCADYETKLMGVPRLRQQRVSPEWWVPVASHFSQFFKRAYSHLTTENEDTKLYMAGWQTPPKGEVVYRPYRYQPASETNTGVMMGKSELMYDGGGYVENLKHSLGSSLQVLIDLQLDNWINNVTRSVFFTFNIYNRNVDKYTTVTIITECLPEGVYQSQVMIISSPISIDRSIRDNSMVFSLVSISITYTIHLFMSAILVAKNGIHIHYSTVSGATDSLVIFSGFCLVLAYSYRYFRVFFTAQLIEESARDEYASIHDPLTINDVILVTIGFFSVSVSAYCGILIHKFIGFSAIKKALLLTRTHFFYVLFFKETYSFAKIFRLETYNNQVVFVFIFLIFFQVNLKFLSLFYAETSTFDKVRMKRFVRFRRPRVQKGSIALISGTYMVRDEKQWTPRRTPVTENSEDSPSSDVSLH